MTQQTAPKPKIVAVDDNALSLRVLAATLDTFDLTLVSDSTKAIVTVERVKPELVVLDLLMPELDGADIAKAIRAHPEFKDLPILFLSAKSETSEIVRCFNAGGNDYVTKPFVREELLARISAQINLRNAERERQQLERQVIVNGRLSSLASLTAGLSHEINNPLAIIMATAHQLENHLRENHPDSTTPETVKLLERLHRNGKRIANVVTSLQTYTKVPLDDEELFTIQAIVEQTTELLRGLYESQRIAFRVETKDPNMRFRGCGRSIEFIINSLISNAHDSLIHCNNLREIQLTIRRNGSFAELIVSDTGDGIAKEHMPLIFSPFFTTKSPGKGMGMSLCIVQQMVTKMQGTIEVQSEQGKGTEVTVRIPIQEF
jgi:signal transduction histidine kinase